MIGILTFLSDCYHATKSACKSRYKILFLFYCLWLYRVEFMPADGMGLAKAIQIIATLGILYYITQYKKNIIRKAYTIEALPYSSILWLYTYATITSLFSIMPQFACCV
jgi:hypothetical protein